MSISRTYDPEESDAPTLGVALAVGPVLVECDGAGVPVPGVDGLPPDDGDDGFVPDGEVLAGALCLPPVDGDELPDDEVLSGAA